jgi:hypothetical protein
MSFLKPWASHLSRTLRQECGTNSGTVVLVEIVGDESKNKGGFPDGGFTYLKGT